MFSRPEDICPPPDPAAAQLCPLPRGDHLTTGRFVSCFCFSFLPVGHIGKTQQELGHRTHDSGLHRSCRGAEHVGRRPESWDPQRSEALGSYLHPPWKGLCGCYSTIYAWSLRVQTLQRSELVLSRLPSYVKVYTIQFLNKYV